MLRADERTALAVILCLFLVLSGCFAPDNAEPMIDPVKEELVFSWSPSPDARSAVFRIEVIAGIETSCAYSSQFESGGGSPEGFTYTYVRATGLSGLIYIGHSEILPATLHAGPVNTGQAANANPFWKSTNTGDIPLTNGTFFIQTQAMFGTLTVTEGEPWIHVTCDSQDAKVRFYETDQYAAVYSPYATGGAGLAVYPRPLTADTIHVNHGDRYGFETKGETIHVGLISFPYEHATMPYQSGHLLFETPEGPEEIDLEDIDSNILREYDSSGSYGLYMERIAVGYTPLGGLMAGFVIHTDLGDLETMPDGFYLD